MDSKKHDLNQLLMMRQTKANVLGSARLGAKMGLRCKTQDAERLFADIRPGNVFLPVDKQSTWLIGPFPYGTVKSSIADALQSLGWQARPIQAMSAGLSTPGMMYKLQACTPPPCNKLSMSHGDVLVSRLDEDVNYSGR